MAIPVFSIHGNHDDPSGEGHFAALDLLEMSGLLNYYGRTPQSDNIEIKPVLLQKGNTKLALYGLSNVRDERLFRTFRDGGVKFFQPGTQKDDWFNIMSVHQNHHAYTETGYLPESFLPSFLDLVVWGHEHECLIDPRSNPETGFRVMQPGSSVATSLAPGEAVPKHVAILSIKGKDYTSENIRLKTVRPFVMREIVLQTFPEMKAIAYESNNQIKVKRFLKKIIDEMIEEANHGWLDLHRESVDSDDEEEEEAPPLPLIRLRVEYTAPDGGKFEIDNPQRFSNEYVSRVANIKDIVQFHRKRVAATRVGKGKAEMPDESIMAQLSLDSVKVEKLVREFLTAQSLTILPQNSFSDAVGQFVDKDDKHAMEMFVEDSLKSQVAHLIGSAEDDEFDEDAIEKQMEEYKATLEKAFSKGELKRSAREGTRKPKPSYWDSDEEGRHWEDQLESIIRSGDEDAETAPKKPAARGRGGKAAAGTTRKAAAPKKAPAKGRTAKKKQPFEEDSDEDDGDDDGDVIMIEDDDDDDDDDDDSADEDLFVKPAPKKAPAKTTKKAPAPKAPKAPKAPTTRGKQQSTLASFGLSQASSTGVTGPRSKAPSRRAQEPSDDEISDDDAFEAPPAAARRSRR